MFADFEHFMQKFACFLLKKEEVKSIGNPAGIGKGTGFGLRDRDRDGIGLGHYRLRANPVTFHGGLVQQCLLYCKNDPIVKFWCFFNKRAL